MLGDVRRANREAHGFGMTEEERAALSRRNARVGGEGGRLAVQRAARGPFRGEIVDPLPAFLLLDVGGAA